MGNFVDLTGQVFGRLRVLEREGSQKAGPTWRCLCRCGQEAVILGCKLKSGSAWACHGRRCPLGRFRGPSERAPRALSVTPIEPARRKRPSVEITVRRSVWAEVAALAEKQGRCPPHVAAELVEAGVRSLRAGQA